jgi:glycerol-1-phosphate dehydrogenase [NAD(P)+]
MIAAGLGDSICRTTCQADWLMSHLLLGTQYSELPYRWLAPLERELSDQVEGLVHGDLGAVRVLTEILVLSGLGMTVCGSSSPASQGEHLISHYIDMLGPGGSPASLHGEQVAVATLTMSRIQERMLGLERVVLHPDLEDQASVLARYGKDLGPLCWEEFERKRLTGARLEEANDKLGRSWSRLRATVSAVSRSTESVYAALRGVGAPLFPADLGISAAFYGEAVRHAREIRGKFTFLDLAAGCGLLTKMEGLA